MAFETEREHLLTIAEISGGLLTVDMVIEDARNKISPLHKHFEWDDSTAAEEYRRCQARALIAKCKVTIDSREDTQIRAFVSLPSDRANGGGYRLSAEVLDNEDQRSELLRDILARVRYWQSQAALLSPATREALHRFDRALQAVPQPTISASAA